MSVHLYLHTNCCILLFHIIFRMIWVVRNFLYIVHYKFLNILNFDFNHNHTVKNFKFYSWKIQNFNWQSFSLTKSWVKLGKINLFSEYEHKKNARYYVSRYLRKKKNDNNNVKACLPLYEFKIFEIKDQFYKNIENTFYFNWSWIQYFYLA